MSSDALLLVLHVLLIRHLVLLLRCHCIAWCHSPTSRHTCLWSWDLRMIDVFRRVDGRFGVNAVLIPRSGLGRIETSLELGTLGRGSKTKGRSGSILG